MPGELDINSALKRGFALLGALMLVFVLASCYLPSPSFSTGRYISRTELGRIEPGLTTKQQLLDAFGPPMGIATRGEDLYLQRPVQWMGGVPLRWGIDIQSGGAMFEFFALREGLGPGHRVYYFYSSSGRQRAIFLLVYINERSWVEMDRLWVLVNEETGIVEDYQYMPRSGKPLGVLNKEE